MNDLRQAAQMALEALEDLGMRHFENTGEKLYADIYIALRTALEQQAEPVHGDIRALKYRIHELEGEVMGYKRMLDVAEAASQQKPLTDEQLDDIAVVARRGNLHDLRIAIEAKLKEKNT